MPHSINSAGTVLVIEPDPSIRQMLQAVLSHVGFTTHCVADDGGLSSPFDERFDVIVRDVNLAPHKRTSALQELERVAPELMRRTVITTTAPAILMRQDEGVPAFAVVAKPFEIDALVDTIRQCRERSRRRRTRAARQKTAREEHERGSVDVGQIRQFVRSVPSLRALLAPDPVSTDELLLRTELRRTALDLARVLCEAAHAERNGARAAVLTGATLVAAELAGIIPAAHLQTPEHDH